MTNYLKEFTSFYDDTLLNYKAIKDSINVHVNQRLAEIKANPLNNLAGDKSDSNTEKARANLTVNNLSRL